MTLNQIIEKLKMENARSMEIHGKWVDLPKEEQLAAVAGEFDEWLMAVAKHDINGEHGEVVELVHLMNVAARRIMYLTGEEQ